MIHSKFESLEEGAEKLSLHMPVKSDKDSHLYPKENPWYGKLFFQDLFHPKVPKQENHLTVPYKKEHGEAFKGHDKKEEFFSRAQRSHITKFLLERTHYEIDDENSNDGEMDEKIGITSLIKEGCFDAAFSLHDGPYKVEEDGKIDSKNKRQLLYREWSHPRNWFKHQPIDEIRNYFGEKVGLYFVWIGFYTSWLLFPSLIGIIVTLSGLFTASTQFNPVAREICDEDNREFFYMCPLCDETCDFWYYRSSCVFAHFSLLFDFEGTVFFAAFMALWAVLFLEFWKRKEARLQYEWDTQWYEAVEEMERPSFVYKVRRQIQKIKTKSKREKYLIHNEILDRIEYYQPPFYLWSRICFAFSIMLTMILIVLGIFLAIIIYRLAVLGPIYHILRHLTGGPSVASLISSITGSIVQLIAIMVMNVFYERAARKLTGWELHRTDSDFTDSFTFKMYIFHFINFYTSLFYIAFFRGNFSGQPGDYNRIGPFRVIECPAYGCLMELTIQLTVIFIGKQILNNILELKQHIFKKLKDHALKRKAGSKQWEQDQCLLEVPEHHLFEEYLELVVQYGFVTIFVAAFPLAPFFAWLNNIIEIRLDAYKFVQLFRRPVAECTQDIGAWFHILHFTTKLCVVTNALIIAFTSNFIDREVYERLYSNQQPAECYSDNNATDCPHGFVTWSTSPVNLNVLLEPIEGTAGKTSFPLLTIMETPMYIDGEQLDREVLIGKNTGKIEPVLYQPFLNFSCLMDNLLFDYEFSNFTKSEFRYYYTRSYFQNLTLRTVDGNDDGTILTGSGICFLNETKCRFRGQVDSNGEHPSKYWRTLAAKLLFVILFENVIYLIGICIDHIIPDIPRSVKDEIRHEKHVTAKAIAEHKARIAKEARHK